ncbi:MAG: DUF5681 domain-containing protein [Oceanicaulis sp.]
MSKKQPNIQIRHRTWKNAPPEQATAPEPIDSNGHDPHRPVGYANPPRKTQFKKGQSGNPKGRPRRKKAISEMLDEVLYQLVEISERGRRKKVPAVEALLRRHLSEAMKGDAKAWDRLMKLRQAFGPPTAEAQDGATTPSPAEEAMLAELAGWLRTDQADEPIANPKIREDGDD